MSWFLGPLRENYDASYSYDSPNAADDTPHTLFAPTNAAIAKLDDATRTKILTSAAYRKGVLKFLTEFSIIVLTTSATV